MAIRDRNFRIAVYGAFNHPNFGDQILFSILYDWLKEYDKQLKIVVPWADKAQIDWPKDVIVGGGWKNLLSCDALVFGGGGYLGEPGKPSKNELPKPDEYPRLDKIGTALPLPKYLGGQYFGTGRYLRANTLRFLKCAEIAAVLSVGRIPCCIIGTGLGPVTTKPGRLAVAFVLKRAKKIILRDEQSAYYAKRLSPRKKIIAGADMVLSRIDLNLKKLSSGMEKVGIHLGPNDEKKIKIDNLFESVRKIVDDGVEVTFISDCKPVGLDLLAVPEMIAARLKKGQVRIIPYKDVSSLLDVFDSLDLVLTSKLHVGMVAYAKGIFPVSIAAHIKTRRFYKQAGLNEFCFDLSNEGIKQAFKRLNQIREKVDIANELLSKNRLLLRDLANENKKVLECFLNKHIFYME